jgi:hypothetical protein
MVIDKLHNNGIKLARSVRYTYINDLTYRRYHGSNENFTGCHYMLLIRRFAQQRNQEEHAELPFR